jgi:hypothetical protein
MGGDNREPNGFVEGLQGFLLQVEVSEIIAHEADEPNAVVDLLDAESLARQHGRDVDFLATQAEASASGHQNVAVVERVGQFRQAVVTACRRGISYREPQAPGRLVPFERGLQRYRALERFLSFVMDVIAPSHAAFHLTQATDGRNPRELQAKAVSALCFAERFASEAKFIAGDQFTIADIVAVTITAAMEPMLPWNTLPNLKRWFCDIERREVSRAASKRSIVSEHGLTNQTIKEIHVPRVIGLIGVDSCFSCLR